MLIMKGGQTAVKAVVVSDETVFTIVYTNDFHSPFAALEGYQLDYENPYGAGCITIIDVLPE